jgi:type I restriction-modification system DNA methylase subunit
MFHGFDFDATMLRIAAMNLMLHGVDDPDIYYQDTLSTGFTDKYPKAASEGFDVTVLAVLRDRLRLAHDQKVDETGWGLALL